ncbi:Regulatory protein PHO2 [Candida viswanathii]|uniref:Regulatory protein PHO2 n=1 Tax=Candida viswanathii TaxID=5486 RepID=A0A367YJN2_9ASCO|nr:Regulatory protein PHO2 [Candida viswanathii]
MSISLESPVQPQPPPSQTTSTTTDQPPQPTQKRIRATGEALEFLISEFQKNANPSPEHRKFISQKACMNEKAVRIWFQNRRAKQRKFERQRLRINNGNTPNDFTTSLMKMSNNSIPIQINDKYCFINCSSLSVGSWQRIKTGIFNESVLKNNLINLSPFVLNQVMTNVDLLIILSKKNSELNYFFLAISNNSKILFRIFYPLNSIAKCSVFKNNFNNSLENSSEIRLNLSYQPKFSVYFFNNNASPNTMHNQWSICDDFSEGQQVSQAYTKIHDGVLEENSVPHVLVGATNALQFLSNYILQHQQQQLQQLQQLHQTPPVYDTISTNVINNAHPLDLENDQDYDLESILDPQGSINTPNTFTPQQAQVGTSAATIATITTTTTNFNGSPFSVNSVNQYYESEITNSPQNSLKKMNSNTNNDNALFTGITRFNTTETSPVEDILFGLEQNLKPQVQPTIIENASYTHVKTNSGDLSRFPDSFMEKKLTSTDDFDDFGDFVQEFDSNSQNFDSFIDFGN